MGEGPGNLGCRVSDTAGRPAGQPGHSARPAAGPPGGTGGKEAKGEMVFRNITSKIHAWEQKEGLLRSGNQPCCGYPWVELCDHRQSLSFSF